MQITCTTRIAARYILRLIVILAAVLATTPVRSVPVHDLMPTLLTESASNPDWHILPHQGVEHTVYALALVGSDLYLGGEFTQTNDGSLTNLGGIVRYNTTTRTWHALPNQGTNGSIRALAVVGNSLYAGGEFTQTGDSTLTNLGNIARYDIAGDTWHALPKQGVDSIVWALTATGDDLYVGGNFTQSGDGTLTNLGRIARYDTVGNTWHTLPKQGLNGYVLTLTMVGNDLYAGGLFTLTGDGTLTNLGHIVRYDTTASTWHSLPNQGLNDGVYALMVSGTEVYMGGNFTQTGDATKTLSHITRYNSAAGTWHGVANQGVNDVVLSIAQIGDDIYAGGQFTETGDGSLTDLGRIARYDTVNTTWYALPNQGLNSWVDALIVVEDDLYAGGHFNITGDSSLAPAHIVRYGEAYTVYLPLVLGQ